MEATRTRDGEATQARILQAAARSFAEKGMGGTSVSEIAAAAGVTKSLIHHHFGSKKGLWDAIKERHFSEYFQAQSGMLDRPPDVELLRDSVEAYFRFLQRKPAFLRLIGWMQLEETGEDRFELGEQLTRAAVAKIRAAQEEGNLRADVHPFSMLISFLGLVEHWFQGKSLHARGLGAADRVTDDDEYLADLMKIFFEGVVPRTATGDE